MPTISITPEALAKSCQTYQRELLMMPVIALSDTLQHVTLMPGIRYKDTIGELTGDAQLGPYSKTRKTDANAVIKGREIEVFQGNCAYGFDPNEVYQSIYGNSLVLGDGMMDNDITRQVVSFLAARLGKNLNDHVWDAVRNAAGDKTVDLFNGFDTIIASEVTSKTLSTDNKNFATVAAITDVNATDTLKKFYRSASEVLKRQATKMFIPGYVYDAYVDDYQTRHGALPYNQQFDKTFLEGSHNLCELVVLPNMSASKYIKITTKPNLVLGTDISGDESNINVAKYASWELTFEAKLTFGAQIKSLSPEMMMVGEIQTA